MPIVIATGTQAGTTGTPCDRQPVHILGTVRPHGVPLVPPPVLVDREQLERAFPNLVANASDAMRDRLDARWLLQTMPLDGDRMALVVADNGPGLSCDTPDHAFEPFFSTRDAGQGTGLGLAQVYGFVRQSGGTTLIEGRPGDGVRVRLVMPTAVRESNPVPLAGPA